MTDKGSWNSLRYWWRDLSVGRKLYTVFGIMAFLIGFELFVLSFAMNTLSSVRAFVVGESHWSKAQKDAINSLQTYIITGNEEFYLKFEEFLQVPIGDQKGLAEVEKENPSWNDLMDGFIMGKNHPDDIEGMYYLLRRFGTNKYIHEAIVAWKKANIELDELVDLAAVTHQEIQKADLTEEKMKQTVAKLDVINDKLTILENKFSSSLSAGSRWMESWVFFILLMLVLTVEATGLIFTMTFSQHLSKMLKKMTNAAEEIGHGDFSQKIDIKSQDELGQLAQSINKMARQLKNNIGRRKEAEDANKTKSLFLANMSHEIRTPLSSIMGFAQLMKKSEMTVDEKEKYIDIILNAGESLTNVINDILDISKVESGHLTIEKSDFSLTKMLSDLEKLLKFKCEEKGITLIFEIDKNIPEKINTDPVRLRQILLNLLSNAIKFTDSGEVKMMAHEKNSMLYFNVFDTGMGVDDESRELIFERFRQSDDNLNRQKGGTGLGLPLSQHLSQLLGGDLVLIDSEKNKGSQFQATIKYKVVNPSFDLNGKNDLQEDKINLKGLKLLIIEDSEDIRLLLEEVLSQWGCLTFFAKNGHEGVEMAQTSAYDLILSDIQMPGMDGYEVVKRLRKDFGITKPIIAQTAHAMKEERDRCIECGFNDVIVKPIDIESLVRLLAKYSRQKSKASNRGYS